MLKIFYNLFYYNYILVNYQVMFLSQSLHFQLNLSFISDVYMLMVLFSLFFIESHGIKQVVELKTSKKL